MLIDRVSFPALSGKHSAHGRRHGACSLEGFMGLMKDSADLLTDSVALYADSGEFMDIHAMVGAMTVQVVGSTAFGYGTRSAIILPHYDRWPCSDIPAGHQ